MIRYFDLGLLVYVGNTYKRTGGKNWNTVNRYQHFN